MLSRPQRDWLERKLGRLEQTSAVRFSISSRYALTADDRGRLQAQIVAAETALRPGDAAAIGEMVGVMLLGFQRSYTPETAKKTIALYVSQLASFPNWAVKAACEDALRNGGDFAPTVPSMVKRCKAATLDMRTDIVRARRLLNADVYREPSPEEREANCRRFKEILSQTIGRG